ncbi:hypothetical protein [Haladaptatus sp. R4]|uniref:hypothetical protein n=1 Tax=Haladaptatus sp. R4 TaxID=1679489 RepID=UPI001237862B|nr:hypothetical protein [Haladaptatus sp. R4]
MTSVVVPNVSFGSIKETFVSRSPAHFKRGDMRQAYGWTSAILTAIATVGVLALALRVLLTGLLVTFVTSDILVVVGFNVCVTLLVGRWIIGQVRIHPLERRQLGVQAASFRPGVSEQRYRRARESSTTTDRL